MRTVGWLIRSRLRRRWSALIVIALIAVLGSTAHAYSRYLDRANVADVTINPSLVSKDIDRAIRTLPGVEGATHSALFLAAIYDGPPPTKAQLEVTRSLRDDRAQ